METKVTFRPLKHGKFRCYLNGKITGIITKNCEAVRSRMYNQNRQNNNQGLIKGDPSDSTKSVMADWDNTWSCPHCGRTNSDGYSGQTKDCWRCHKKARRSGVKQRPAQRETYFSWF